MNGVSTATHTGTSLLVATLASVLFATVFVMAEGGSGVAWVVSAASVALLLGPATLGIASTPRRVQALLAGLALPVGPLMLLGSVVKTATHHRPLGAATFAVIACALTVGSVAFAWRTFAMTDAVAENRGRLIRSVVGGAAIVSGGWALTRLAQLTVSSDFVFGVAEACLLVVALWVSSRAKTRQLLAKVPTMIGVIVWALVVLAGVILASSLDPKAARGLSTAVLWLLFAP